MTDKEIAMLGRIIAVETLVMGVMTERAGQYSDPEAYLTMARTAISQSAQMTPWDDGGDPMAADQVNSASVDAMNYLFARMTERVRAARQAPGT